MVATAASLKSPEGGNPLDEIYRGTGSRSGRRGAKGPFVQLKRPSVHWPQAHLCLSSTTDRSALPAVRARCTRRTSPTATRRRWTTAGGIQAKFEDTCREYAASHQTAAMHATLPWTLTAIVDSPAEPKPEPCEVSQ